MIILYVWCSARGFSFLRRLINIITQLLGNRIMFQSDQTFLYSDKPFCWSDRISFSSETLFFSYTKRSLLTTRTFFFSEHKQAATKCLDTSCNIHWYRFKIADKQFDVSDEEHEIENNYPPVRCFKGCENAILSMMLYCIAIEVYRFLTWGAVRSGIPYKWIECYQYCSWKYYSIQKAWIKKKDLS
jgi:hypothetical protein